MPHQLSGGQQQRVALARAMAVKPHALLMDEPFSNLDASLRKSLRRELLEFHRKQGGTVLYVTHDQEEALALSDRIAVMMDGRIVECGPPAELYARPRRLETALFLGDMNVMRDDRIPADMRREPHPRADMPKGAGTGSMNGPSGGTVLCIRPENVRVHAIPAADGDGSPEGILKGTLAFKEFMGTHATLGVETASGRLLARAGLSEAGRMRKGQPLFLEFPAEHRLWY